MVGKKGTRVFNLGTRLKYPITITKLYKRPGDQIALGEPVLQYSYKSIAEIFNKKKGAWETAEETNVTEWSGPEDAKLLEWQIHEGDTVAADRPCLTVEEACTHEVQVAGLCAWCGKDMSEVSWANEQRDTDRAPINMTHDQTNLTVSRTAAAQAEYELQRRLLEQRKLSLVVDLDQTIIHACIEPTVGEWQRDTTSPNYEAVKDVKSFQLNDDGPRGLASGCWYYIKTRPGLDEFLRKVGEMYELHVYTMGTRAYAMNIAKIVDPEQKLFGNRVISRDENGSLTAKSLQRLFPVSTNMVVIIDDRADGIGDINSSFLPKRQDLLSAPVQQNLSPKGPATNGAANGAANGTANISALEELAKMGGEENPALLKTQMEEQERSLEKQIKDRPLLQMQEQLDKEDEATTQETEQNGDEPSQSQTHAHPRHHLLLDNDSELSYLEEHLTMLHRTFFEEYEARRAEASQSQDDGNLDGVAGMTSVPDVGTVLDGLKAHVLRGTTIVLSGLVPLGVDVASSEIGLQARTFGAQLQTKVSKKITHLVISSDRPRTQKVRQAAKIPNIRIVNQDWLAACFSQWKHIDETPYLIEIHPEDRVRLSATATPNEMTDAETISDVDVDMGGNAPKGNGNGSTKLRIVVSGPSEVVENEQDDDEDSDDEGDAVFELDDPDDRSPIEELKRFDWGSADDELAEFLAEDGDENEDNNDNGEGDDDMEDEAEADGSQLVLGTKRKLGDDTEPEAISARDESIVSKKQRLAIGHGGSNLGAARSTETENSSLPSPQVTGDEEDVLQPKSQAAVEPIDDDIDDDQLEADLLAELESEEALADNG